MKEKPEAIIFDVDGTLCDVSGIRHYVVGVEKGKENYDAFHRSSLFCPPHAHVVEAVRQAKRGGLGVLIVTARRARYRRLTLDWLTKHDIPCDAFHIRNDTDDRPDVEVKRDILERIRRDWTVVHAWDDNPAVLELWQREGIPYTEVPGWGEAHGEEKEA